MENEEIKIELQDTEWEREYIDHDRNIARAIVYDENGMFYFVRAERDDDFGKTTLIETAGGGVEKGEELSMYDMLFNDDLSKEDIKAIKKVAVDLLSKIKAKISELDHWTDKQETKAEIDNLIRDTLWMELPECYDEIRISEYRQRIYEYVYMRYKEVA